jgi:hypothetical protein
MGLTSEETVSQKADCAFQVHLLAVEECTPERVDELAGRGATGIALPLTRTRSYLQTAIDTIQKAGLAAWGWIEIGRDEEAAEAHPEWMHMPQHPEWLQDFPDWTGGPQALVYPWVCVNNVETFAWAVQKVRRLANAYPGLDGCFLNDIQGPPVGCGCGNILCRSWDNSPGIKIAPAPYAQPELFFTAEFVRACQEILSSMPLVPVICSECEIGVTIGGVESPDSLLGSCHSIPCARPCALEYFPGLAKALEGQSRVGLLALYKLFGRDRPLYGEIAGWVRGVVEHYLRLAPKTNLIAVLQGWDVTAAEREAQVRQAITGGARGILMAEMPIEQSWKPTEPPPGYQPTMTPIL